MRKTRLAVACVFTLVGAMVLTAPAGARPPTDPAARGSLEVYVGTLDAKQLAELRGVGVDLTDTAMSRDKAGNTTVQVVLSTTQATRLASKGLKLQVKKVGGQDASRARPGDHLAGRQHGAVVPAGCQPGRLRLHLHPRQPAVAQEPARQQR